MRTRPMLLLLFSVAAAAQVTVEGDVVRKSTGEPLAGVRVSGPCGPAVWTATDVTGHFRCTSTPDFRGKSMAMGSTVPDCCRGGSLSPSIRKARSSTSG